MFYNIERGESLFCEMSAMVTKYVTNPLRCLCGFCERFVRIERES